MAHRDPVAKYRRRLAKAQARLEGTRREDYSREQDYKRVVTLRSNKVKQIESLIERLKGDSEL
ncbi:hypothetical protein [Candidatus Darwinibacter acetoxidans]